MGAQNNTNLVLNKGYEDYIPATLKADMEKLDPLNKITFGLYEKLWNKKLGVKLNKKEQEVVEKLADMQYLDKDIQEYNFQEYIDLVKEYLEPPPQQGKGKGKPK